MKPGRSGTMTHDYKRNGTTTLFAALDVLSGSVIGECLPRHRHEEFLKFLRIIDREVPKRLQIHLILDNYRTHKHADVNAWLAKHPRFHLHFTPTSSSWLNLVERFFGKLTEKAIRRGVFHSVPDLIAAIGDYLDADVHVAKAPGDQADRAGRSTGPRPAVCDLESVQARGLPPGDSPL
jgi:transposase